MKSTKRSVGARLIESMQQAVDIAQGRAQPSTAYSLPLTAREVVVPPAPEFTADDVAALRERLQLSQQVFAEALNVSLGTVRSWEQGEKPPHGPSRRLLQIAASSPQVLLGMVQYRTKDSASLRAREVYATYDAKPKGKGAKRPGIARRSSPK